MGRQCWQDECAATEKPISEMDDYEYMSFMEVPNCGAWNVKQYITVVNLVM